MLNAEMYAHLEQDCPGAGASSSSDTMGDCVQCPICDAQVRLTDLDAHIEAGCRPSSHTDSGSSGSGGGASSSVGASTVAMNAHGEHQGDRADYGASSSRGMIPECVRCPVCDAQVQLADLEAKLGDEKKSPKKVKKG